MVIFDGVRAGLTLVSDSSAKSLHSLACISHGVSLIKDKERTEKQNTFFMNFSIRFFVSGYDFLGL